MIDFDILHYDQLYSQFGQPAQLFVGAGGAGLSVVVIDQTRGIDVALGALSLPSIKPVAMVRSTELERLGLKPSDLLEAVLVFNGLNWQIKQTKPRPGPLGKGTGEVMLILVNGDL